MKINCAGVRNIQILRSKAKIRKQYFDEYLLHEFEISSSKDIDTDFYQKIVEWINKNAK